MLTVSVIVPVYNVEQYLSECVDSILLQTFEDFELILVDDGSTDQCGVMCDNYVSQDERVKVIHTQNSGLSAARNEGIALARGKYIAFVDSDDVVNIHYLEMLVQSLNNYNADIAVCQTISFEEEFDWKKDFVQGEAICLSNREAVLGAYDFYRNSAIMACSKLFRRELFDQIRFPVGRIHEDQFIIPILYYKASCVVVLNERLYGYRIRHSSIIHQNFSLRRFDDIEALDQCITFFDANDEAELSNAAQTMKHTISAYYTLLARKAGIYDELPKKYRMSRLQAIYILRTMLPYEIYSYRVAQIYPFLISIQAHLNRILQMIGLREKKICM